MMIRRDWRCRRAHGDSGPFEFLLPAAVKDLALLLVMVAHPSDLPLQCRKLIGMHLLSYFMICGSRAGPLQ